MPALLANGLSENPRQLRLPFGVVVLDRSLTITESKGYKVPRPSFLKSDWRCNKKAEISLVESIVIGIKQSPFFTGIRFHYDKHYSAMSIILANLLHADTGNRQLLFKRDTRKRVIKFYLNLLIVKIIIKLKTYINFFWLKKIVSFLSQLRRELLEEDIQLLV